MQPENQIQEDIKKIKQYFRKKETIAAVFLFGSTVTGKQSTGNDIDVAVMFNPYSFERQGFDFLAYVADMEGFASRRVDLVCFNTADPLLKHQIMKYGTVIIDRDPKSRISQMVWAMADYEDYKYQLNLSSRKMRREMLGSE